MLVIAACFLPMLYIYGLNFDPIALSAWSQQPTRISTFDTFFLIMTLIFEGSLVIAWGYALIARRKIMEIRPLALLFTVVGAVLTVLVFGGTLTSERNIPAASGLWLLMAGYALALAGVVLLSVPSAGAVRMTVSGILIAASLAAGIGARFNALHPPQFLHCNHGAAAVSGTTIYGDDDSHLRALRASDGALLWSCNYFNNAINPVLVTHGMLIGIGGTSIIALRSTDGAVVWQHETTFCQNYPNFRVDASVTSADTLFLLMSCHADQPDSVASASKALALHVTDGALLWQQNTSENTILGATGNVLLLANGAILWQRAQGFSYKGSVTAVRIADGSLAWHADVAGMALKQDAVIVIQPDGTLAALQAADGTMRWHSAANIIPRSPLGIHPFVVSATDDDTIYVVNDNLASGATLMAVRLSDGKQLWSGIMGKHIKDVFPEANKIYVSAWPMDGSFALQAVRKVDGASLWQNKHAYSNAFAIAGSMAYLVQPNALIALDATNGKQRWQCSNSMAPQSIVGVADGAVYVLGYTGVGPGSTPQLVAVRMSDGAVLWRTANFSEVLLP
jgi:outer membrane protein assembly factor BamB